MILQQGPVSKLVGRPWAALDLTSEARLEEVVLAIARWARARVAPRPFQLFFPVGARGVHGIEMLSPHLYVRTRKLGELGEIAQAIAPQRALVELVREAGGRVLPIEDTFVQEVIGKARGLADRWSRGIKVGSFVRILYGSNRMLSGAVLETDGRRAVVDVSLRLRHLHISSPVRALRNLGMKEREYYYVG